MRAEKIDGPLGTLYEVDGKVLYGYEVIKKYSKELKDILDKNGEYESPEVDKNQTVLDLN